MSNVVGYAIGEYVHGEDDEDEDEEKDFYEIVTAWINPRFVSSFCVNSHRA